MNNILQRINAALALVALLAAPCALAETVNTVQDLLKSKRVSTYIHSTAMLKAAYQLGVMQDRKFGLHTKCKSKYFVKPYSVSILAPIIFPENKKHPTQGAWNLRYILERCGESKIYNAFVMAKEGTIPKPQPYFPGNSLAGYVLTKDALKPAVIFAGAKLKKKDCKDIALFDRQVLEMPHDVTEKGKTMKGVWKENWIFRMCKKELNAELTFIPDGKGGTNFFAH